MTSNARMMASRSSILFRLPRRAPELREEYGELPPQRRTARCQPVRVDAQERAKGGDDGAVGRSRLLPGFALEQPESGVAEHLTCQS